jgi:hypothetical protein
MHGHGVDWPKKAKAIGREIGGGICRQVEKSDPLRWTLWHETHKTKSVPSEKRPKGKRQSPEDHCKLPGTGQRVSNPRTEHSISDQET